MHGRDAVHGRGVVHGSEAHESPLAGSAVHVVVRPSTNRPAVPHTYVHWNGTFVAGMSPDLETVQDIYDAFARGDIETVLAAFADDITWVEAAGGPYGGSYHGPDEVLKNVFGPIDREWRDFRVDPERFIDAGNPIVATGTYSGTYETTEKSFQAPFAHVWDFEDGRVVRFEQYIDTALHNEPLDAER